MATSGPVTDSYLDALLEPVATFCCQYKVPLTALVATATAITAGWALAEQFDLLPDLSSNFDGRSKIRKQT